MAINLKFDQEKYKQKIFSSKPYLFLVDKCKETLVSRKYKISLFDLFKEYNASHRSEDISSRSKAVAYNFTLAIFPSIIFLFTLVPYLPFEQYISVNEILTFLENYLPIEVWEFIGPTIEDIIGRHHGGMLSFGFLFAMWLATNGMYSLIDAFNKIYKSKETRNLVVKRLVSFLLTLILVFVLISAILLLVLGQIIVGLIEKYIVFMAEYDVYLGRFTQIATFTIIFLLSISSIYTIAPSVKKRWRFITVGSVLGSIMSIIVSAAFSYYLNNFSSYNKIYGSIGALIGIMAWLQMMAWILLFGFQVNACIDAIKLKSIRNKLHL